MGMFDWSKKRRILESYEYYNETMKELNNFVTPMLKYTNN